MQTQLAAVDILMTTVSIFSYFPECSDPVHSPAPSYPTPYEIPSYRLPLQIEVTSDPAPHATVQGSIRTNGGSLPSQASSLRASSAGCGHKPENQFPKSTLKVPYTPDVHARMDKMGQDTKEITGFTGSP